MMINILKKMKKELEEPLEVSTKTGCNIFFAIVICNLLKPTVAYSVRLRIDNCDLLSLWEKI